MQILVRIRNDRVMHRDPAPEPPRRGRPRKHSADRFECGNPARPPGRPGRHAGQRAKTLQPDPGRPKGRTSTPATRFPVIKKAA